MGMVGPLVPDAHLDSSLAVASAGSLRPDMISGWDTRADRSHDDRTPAAGSHPSGTGGAGGAHATRSNAPWHVASRARR